MSKMGRVALELQEHGFETIEEAQANGYDLIDDKLYETAGHTIQSEKETQLNLLDEVIGYLKDIEADNEDMLADMIDNLRTVERYIKEN